MTTRFLPGMTTRYGIVFQKADDRLAYDSHQAFGHDEEGGSIGIADPSTRGTASPTLRSPGGCRSPAARTPGASAWLGSCASAPQSLSRTRLAIIVERFQYVEVSHVLRVLCFRVLKRFHANATGTNAASFACSGISDRFGAAAGGH